MKTKENQNPPAKAAELRRRAQARLTGQRTEGGEE